MISREMTAQRVRSTSFPLKGKRGSLLKVDVMRSPDHEYLGIQVKNNGKWHCVYVPLEDMPEVISALQKMTFRDKSQKVKNAKKNRD